MRPLRRLISLALGLLAILAASPALAEARPVPAADQAYSQGDFAKAGKLWREACEAGNATGCYELAMMYRDGEGVTANRKTYLELLNRACNGGSGMACFNLGINADPTDKDGISRGSKEQQGKAAEYFERGCNLGYAKACANLSYYLGNGLGVPKDLKRSAQLLESACNEDNLEAGRACFMLSGYYDGHDKPKLVEDPALANRYLLRGCNLTDVDSCINLGYHLRTGYGLARDMVRSNTLYAMICDDGSERECPQFTYGEYFSGGGGYKLDNVRPSRREVAGLYQKSCDGGFALGCVALARLVIRSGHAQESEQQIRDLLGRALKLDPGCFVAQYLLDYINERGLSEMDRRHRGEP